MSNPPTLVLIPGAWHKPSCYTKIIKPLQEEHGLKCVPVTLPSTTGDPNATFKDDLDAARSAIVDETTQGRNVVVVVHSYGGMVGNSAIKGLARPKGTSGKSSAQSQGEGYVIGLILIASGFTLTGLTFMDPFLDRPPPSWRVNKETGFADLVVRPQDFFYHDLPSDEADFWASQVTTQSLKSLFEGREYTYAGWLDVPAWYIGTVEDRGLPVVMQRMQTGMARGMGAHVVHVELQTSHSPFLSRPAEIVKIMLEAIEAFTSGKSEVSPKVAEQDKEVSLLAATLWQPTTWYRFGLPLSFGRALGWSIAGFTWVRRSWRSIFG